MSARRPNVVYLHSHDTGRYVQPYGFPVSTPAYQRLAEEGVVFRRAFSAAPTCSPSRAALLTGQSPHAAGLLGLVHRGFRLSDPSQHLATILRDAGYRTAMAGVQHTWQGNIEAEGYLEDRRPADTSSDAIATAAVAVLQEQVDQDEPLFLDVGFNDTHRVYPEVEPAAARYVRAPALFPDTPETRLDWARHLASLARLDRAVGRVLDELDRTGLADNTIIVCTTDHGLAWPGMKCNLTDHGIGVLLILRAPGLMPAGTVTDALVSHVDLFPTLCDVLNIERPAWLTGVSLMPLVRGEVEQVNDAVFGEVTYHAAYEPQRAIRTDRWALIERFDERRLPVLPNIDEGETRDLLLANGLAEREVAPLQLYDTLFDPMQLRNLAGDPAWHHVRDDVRARLHAWMAATDDPLLAGPVPMPAGSVANPVDGRTPTDDPLPATTLVQDIRPR
jgi:N-sulfoglucosamine sulfohydrolase